MQKESVTDLLEAHRQGEQNALERAFEIIYDELRRLARYQLGGQGRGRTLNTTALVHEIYLKVAATGKNAPETRGHFLALASRAMRQVIVDNARARATAKRGGDLQKIPDSANVIAVEDDANWILTVDQALDQIRDVNERLSDVVVCRFYAGLGEEETAEALGVSVRTVQRDWRRARAWLQEFLTDDDSPAEE